MTNLFLQFNSELKITNLAENYESLFYVCPDFIGIFYTMLLN